MNLNKSEVSPVRGVANVEDLALVLDCRIGKLLSSYLGLPLRVSQIFQGVGCEGKI